MCPLVWAFFNSSLRDGEPVVDFMQNVREFTQSCSKLFEVAVNFLKLTSGEKANKAKKHAAHNFNKQIRCNHITSSPIPELPLERLSRAESPVASLVGLIALQRRS